MLVVDPDTCSPLTSVTFWLAVIGGIVTLGNGIINTITIKFNHQSVSNQLKNVENSVNGRMEQLIGSKTTEKDTKED
jgi:uncharacterized membrane protein